MKPVSVTIQTKATEHYFPVVLFIMLRKAVKNRMSVKPLQRYIYMVLFVLQYFTK